MWHHLFDVTKSIFAEKSPKSIPYSTPWAISRAVSVGSSSTLGRCLTRVLMYMKDINFFNFLQRKPGGQEVKEGPEIPLFGILWSSLARFKSPPKFTQMQNTILCNILYQSFQGVKYTENGQNRLLTLLLRGPWFYIFPSSSSKNNQEFKKQRKVMLFIAPSPESKQPCKMPICITKSFFATTLPGLMDHY